VSDAVAIRMLAHQAIAGPARQWLELLRRGSRPGEVRRMRKRRMLRLISTPMDDFRRGPEVGLW